MHFIARKGFRTAEVDASFVLGSGRATRATHKVDLAAGTLFVADLGNQLIRKIDLASGVITTVAGTPGLQSFSGDGGLATAAALAQPKAEAVDSGGNVFIADHLNGRVRRVDAVTRIITTIAGNGNAGSLNDGIPAVQALLSPVGLAFDAAGRLLVTDAGGRIRRINISTGIVTTVAGGGPADALGDGGPAVNARLILPQDIALDAQGNLFIVEYLTGRVRAVRGPLP